MSATLPGRQAGAAILLVVLVVASGIVAWRVPVPANIPAVAWNSPWVFRGEVFVGFFVGAYVVLAICTTTIVSGRPPKKLSFGLLAYEQAELEKAVDALSEGGTALQAVEAEVRGLQPLGPVVSPIEQFVCREDAISADMLDELRGVPEGLNRQARRPPDSKIVVEENNNRCIELP